MRNILVTGSSGFIGRHIVHLLKQTYNVITPTREEVDLSSLEDTNRYLLGLLDLYGVVHCAANPLAGTGGLGAAAQFGQNTAMTVNLLAGLKETGLIRDDLRFINMSSASVYGGNLYINHSAEVRPESYYAASKLAGEAACMAAYKQAGMKCLSMRIVANVGSGAGHGVLPAVIEKLKAGGDLELLSNSVKPFLHVRDTAQGVKALLELPKVVWDSLPYHLNYGPTDNISVERIIGICCNVMNRPQPSITWKGSWKGDADLKYVSNVLAKSRAGWLPRYETSESAILAAAEVLV